MTKPRTLFDKIWDSHLVDELDDGVFLLYIDRHLLHEVLSPQAFEGLRMAKRQVRRPAATLAGLIEIRGLGIRRVPFEPMALVSLVFDLGATDSERLPDPANATIAIAGVTLPRRAVAPGEAALAMLFAALRTAESGH